MSVGREPIIDPYSFPEREGKDGRNLSQVKQRAARREDVDEWSEGLEPWGVEPFVLPGFGEKGARCGEWYSSGVCDTCARIHLTTHTCGKRSCPDCWGVWAKEAGVRATARVQAFRYTQPNDYRRQVAHAVVSPSEGEVMNARQYFEGKKKAAEIAKEKGWRGFAVIPHPYRVNEKGKQRYREENPEKGIWVWLRNDVDGMERYTKWSPHYHIVGFTSSDLEGATEGDEWAYTFIRSMDKRFTGTRDRESHGEVYGTFRYLLSHTGYPEGSTRQVVTWYGDLGNNVFVEEASEEWQSEKPSEGVLSVLEREVEKAAGGVVETGEEGGSGHTEDEKQVCEVEGCDGEVISVFDVRAYLRQCDPPREVRENMVLARDWRLGDVEPPPGLKRPQTEEQAREALAVLQE